ncbi:GntR family transcriptional regulator [Streptomyces sp. NPDC058426]|uniref:GntR family transcriptional regulator n=1 Tax=Streptomyces sp. NPDC058426 TaxID=3346493 RepID=UPI003651C7ED
MDSQPTAVQRPIQLRIADDLRMSIESGELRPGDALPTLGEITERWSCSMNSARAAVALLKSQGLITSGRGKAPRVREALPRVVRSSERHQEEKDLAARPMRERASTGEAETTMGMSIQDQAFTSQYDTVEATDDLARVLDVPSGEPLLRRRYQARDVSAGRLLSSSVSYIPRGLVDGNPAILDEENEPWPGGTQHQLSTVGVEIMQVVDEVTGRMPTTAEAQEWGLPEGVPLLICRRISLDGDGKAVEISDATYPADRTELRFVIPLRPWQTYPPNDYPGKGEAA